MTIHSLTNRLKEKKNNEYQHVKRKIHRATVKQAELDYVGSITVDPVLLEAAGILEYEHVHIVDVNNGNRLRHTQFLENQGVE